MRPINAFIFIVMLNTGFSVHAQPVSVVDDLGNTITLKNPATRIVSLAPNISELLFAAGAGDKIVGVVEYSDYPEKAKSIERIGNHSGFDLERISVLKPDLIIAWQSGNPKGAIEKLRNIGFTVFMSEPQSLNHIVTSMQRFSTLANTEAVANKAIQKYKQRYAQLKKKYQSASSIRVFYEIWYQPMMTINGNHIINEVIEFCGGKNVFAQLGNLAPTISVESILVENPQAIIAGSNIGVRLFDWKRWLKLDAVRYNNLFHVEWDHINRHSPRILNAVVEVCDALNVARKNIRAGGGKQGDAQ